VWVLEHQLGRRNLSTFAKSEIALKLEERIQARAKENLVGGDRKSINRSGIILDEFIKDDTETKVVGKSATYIAAPSFVGELITTSHQPIPAPATPAQYNSYQAAPGLTQT
jgi:hypothetical protein